MAVESGEEDDLFMNEQAISASEDEVGNSIMRMLWPVEISVVIFCLFLLFVRVFIYFC